MDTMKALLLAGALLLSVADAAAQSAPNATAPAPGAASGPAAPPKAPASVRIRGSVAAFDGHMLQVNDRFGRAQQLSVLDNTKISVLSPLKLGDIKKGSFVGVTAVPHGPGPALQALEVHVFPEAMRGTGEGHYDWDLEPGSTMTNANVEAVVNTNDGKALTLDYKGGTQKIFVPKGVPVITFTPADPSLLKPGAHVFIIAQPGADGSLAALRILIGKDGMKPPM